jgi:carbon-monoxide dehydrogenase medium subunit
MIPAAFQYHSPNSVADAIDLLSTHGADAKILAGGQSLIPMMKLRLADPQVIIDLGKISSMNYIDQKDGGVAIGGMTTYEQIESSGAVPSLLSEAASSVADVQVRNRGTIGGSLSHNDPAADLPAAIIALGGEIVTSSQNEHRTIQATDFFIDLFTTDLADNEILSEVFIKAQPSDSGSAYLKFANKASHYAIVGVAVVVETDSDGRCASASIGVSGAGPSAFKAKSSENILVGSNLDESTISEAASQAGNGIEFNDDVHASAEYRAHLLKVYTARAIKKAASRIH